MSRSSPVSPASTAANSWPSSFQIFASLVATTIEEVRTAQRKRFVSGRFQIQRCIVDLILDLIAGEHYGPISESIGISDIGKILLRNLGARSRIDQRELCAVESRRFDPVALIV